MTKTVTIRKNLPQKEGIQAVIRAAIKQHGGDYRAATYDPKTGKGTVR
jgi:Fe-S cluster biogenesis protein NfuA